MSSSEAWWSLLTGQLSDEEARELLAQGVQELHAFLEARPRATEDVLEILDRRLGGEIGAQSWEHVDASLNLYMGRSLASLLAWTAQPDQAARLAELQEYSSPEVMAFFRTLLGRYGAELEAALVRWSELPDDWITLYREVYYDQLNQRPLIRLRIEKYSGDVLLIEGSPDSILSLATGLILTLRLVGIREAFSPDRVEQFVNEARQLYDLLFPEEKGTLDEQAPSDVG